MIGALVLRCSIVDSSNGGGSGGGEATECRKGVIYKRSGPHILTLPRSFGGYYSLETEFVFSAFQQYVCKPWQRILLVLCSAFDTLPLLEATADMTL